jgi:signal transduction histidine kinase
MSVLTPLALGVLFLAGLLVATFLAAPLAVANGGLLEIGRFAVTTQGPAIGLTVVGVLLVPVLLYLSTVFSGAQAALARSLLTREPDPAAAQLVEVARSRARLVDAFDAERHRIERDLHDGAQQRLVNLTMQLGLARLDLTPDSPAATAVAAAHDQAKALMVELRDLIRGINPRTLTELGLAAAVDELAATSAIPVTVRIDGGRLPAPVETVAYYAIAEALTNVAKHSGAGEAAIEVRRSGDTLSAEVRDNGRGGADPRAGSGLTGLADRVAAAGGRLLLSSPAGGPTTVRIELPCGS